MRPVIRTTIEIASRDFDVEMCLADRSQLKHRTVSYTHLTLPTKRIV